MIFLWVPETKQRTLEELDYIFAVPTRTFMHYQLTKALPWWIQRYILFNKSATLEPLYHFDVIKHHSPNNGSKEGIITSEKANTELRENNPYEESATIQPAPANASNL
jgi:hypothetical protein